MLVFPHKKLPKQQLRLGKGATIQPLLRLIHPSATIRAAFSNDIKGQRLEGCVLKRQEVKLIKGEGRLCVVFTHDDFDDVDLYAAKRYCKVTNEGDPDYFLMVIMLRIVI